MIANKIVPCIWLTADDGRLANTISYYKTVFGESFQAGRIVSLGETPSGNTEMCYVEIFGRKYSLMSTASAHHPLNDAVSFQINCEDQQEIDHFWDFFTKEGKESQCGWCIDKYGLRWQIVPHNLSELMQRPHAFQVMMKQTKIVINEYVK